MAEHLRGTTAHLTTASGYLKGTGPYLKGSAGHLKASESKLFRFLTEPGDPDSELFAPVLILKAPVFLLIG